ncbi:hypothetical protein LJK87_00590 [Paenibacillus sp. P25]|nr:hypothetical protein LJK87_00590 [Paenibacillus sp. P25]
MNNASNIVFSGLAMEISRGNAVDMAGGENNLIQDGDISKVGGDAVKINGGVYNDVSGCRICSMSNGGVSLNGGAYRRCARFPFFSFVFPDFFPVHPHEKRFSPV